jgi:hypothetical protein
MMMSIWSARLKLLLATGAFERFLFLCDLIVHAGNHQTDYAERLPAFSSDNDSREGSSKPTMRMRSIRLGETRLDGELAVL